MFESAEQWSASATALQATEEVTVQAAPGAGRRLYVQKGYFTVFLGATGGGGNAALENGAGGTRIFECLASAAGHFPLDLGKPCFLLDVNPALIVTVDGATTNEASVRVTLSGIII